MHLSGLGIVMLCQAVFFQGQEVSAGTICEDLFGNRCHGGWMFVCDTSDRENDADVTCRCICDFTAQRGDTCASGVACVVEPLISGTKYNVSDSQLTASSQWTGEGYSRDLYAPWNSRLDQCPDNANLACCWSPASISNTIGEYIQVDLGRTFEITAVAIQGRGPDQWNVHRWLTRFSLAVSEDGSTYIILDNNGQGYEGAHDSHTVVVRDIPPTRARYVRLVVMAFYEYASVRWELYGCPA